MRISTIGSKPGYYYRDDYYPQFHYDYYENAEGLRTRFCRSKLSPLLFTIIIMFAAGFCTFIFVFVFINGSVSKEARKRESDLELQQVESSGEKPPEISSTNTQMESGFPQPLLPPPNTRNIGSQQKTTNNRDGNSNTHPSSTKSIANNSTTSPEKFFITTAISIFTNKTFNSKITNDQGELVSELSQVNTMHNQTNFKQAIRIPKGHNITTIVNALRKLPPVASQKASITTKKPPTNTNNKDRNNARKPVNHHHPTQNKQSCSSMAICYSDKECGSGRCIGANLGKCNCNNCVSRKQCSTDSDCGGLQGACEESICKCAQALMKHGYMLYIDAIRSFCNQKKCSHEKDDCFGLSCNVGHCKC